MLKSISKSEVKQKVCTGGLKGCGMGRCGCLCLCMCVGGGGWLIWRKWRQRWQIGGHVSHENSNSPCASSTPQHFYTRLHFTSTLLSILGRRAVAATGIFGGMSDEAQGCYMDPFSWLEFSPVLGEGVGLSGAQCPDLLWDAIGGQHTGKLWGSKPAEGLTALPTNRQPWRAWWKWRQAT